MKLSSELHAGWSHPLPPAVTALFDHATALSLERNFRRHRDAGLALAFSGYGTTGEGAPLEPLSHERDLAEWWLCADYRASGSGGPLIDQLRDLVTEHLSSEERDWIDPVRRSAMDLLEITQQQVGAAGTETILRSVGDGRIVSVRANAPLSAMAVGSVLLTRVIAAPGAAASPALCVTGGGLVLSAADGRALFERVREVQRDLELRSGSFALGEWASFCKDYGHALFWAFAQMRLDALVEAVQDIEYRAPQQGRWLYALAAYEHHGAAAIRASLPELNELTPEPVTTGDPTTWTMGAPETVARVTVTPYQLFVECDSPERLDDVKHRLASTFGYALRFRKEVTTPPSRQIAEEDLAATDHYRVQATEQDERRLVADFLEALYADWADTASLALGGATPRHAAAKASSKEQVVALIAELEWFDLGTRRGGSPGYDYDRLRARIGLPETHA
ncbi:MAG: hypothetical protein U0172_12045 [Nitrospiraceae bacterium]